MLILLQVTIENVRDVFCLTV